MRTTGIALLVMLAAGGAVAAGLGDRVAVTSISLPSNFEPNTASWLTWGYGPVGPRLYLIPKNDGSLLLGWTDSSSTGRITRLAGASATTLDSFPGLKLKGLVAHDDGSYAVLHWNSPAENMQLAEYNAAGVQQWATTVDTANTEFDDWLGDSRLTHGNGTYERDPVMARLPDAPGGGERYLVGWRMSNTGEFYLAVVSGAGSIIDGPDPVSGHGIAWGNRDDSFQSRPDGSVSWVYGSANSSTVTLSLISSTRQRRTDTPPRGSVASPTSTAAVRSSLSGAAAIAHRASRTRGAR